MPDNTSAGRSGAPAQATRVKKSSSLAKRNFQKLVKNKMAIIGFILIAVILIMCILAPLFTKWDPKKVTLSEKSKAPSAKHILGTDNLGRDVFSRILYGGRISILIGLTGSLGGVIIGCILGCIAGYYGGWFDAIFLRISEVVQAVPQILLVLVLVTVMKRSLANLFIIFIATGWVGTYRLVRGRFFSLREESYVESSRAFGISDRSIMFRHILPNTLGPIIVIFTLNTAGFILQEAALSYLGLGVPADIPTWGNILNAAREVSTVTRSPWIWLSPGITISLFVLGINFFGDGLRDVFDPNQL